MPRKQQSPRERAARALCTSKNLPENTMFQGQPMWRSFLDEVDVVLEAALTSEEWEQIRAEDGGH